MTETITRDVPRLRRDRRGGVWKSAVAVIVAAALASACSSKSSSSTPGSTGGSSDVVAAKAAVEKAKQPSTTIGQTTPLKSKPPTGKTFVYLNCDFVQCQQTADAIGEAVKPLGWKLQTVAYKSADPATLVAAFKQAVQYNPVAVGLSGVPYAAWSSIVPQYRAARIPIVEGLAGPQTVNDVLVANLFNDQDLAVDAGNLANWMAADSNGKGHAVILGVPDFPILGGFGGAFTKSLTSACPGCKATTVNATIAQIGSPATSNGLLVSALQRDPSIKYVITCDGALSPGLPAALSGAGITGIKIGGALATAENGTQIKAGKEHAFTGQHIQYYGWQLVDAALRHLEGMDIPPGDGGQPHQLLMSDNVGTPSDNLKDPADYQAQFNKLWLVGS